MLTTTGSRRATRTLVLAATIFTALAFFTVQANTAGAATHYTQIGVGLQHACGLTSAGQVECWGANDRGQLGDGTFSNSAKPVDAHVGRATAVAVGDYGTCAIVRGGAYCWGMMPLGGGNYNSGVPVAVAGLSAGVTAISIGTGQSCAIVSGAAKCWGYGYFADGNSREARETPVEIPGLTTGVSSISIGEAGTLCAVDAAKHVRCWGPSWGGMMGDGTDGEWGVAEELQLAQASGVENATSVSVNQSFVCAVSGYGGDGTIQCWGAGYSGELGNGSEDPSNVPVIVASIPSGAKSIATGSRHACAVVEDHAECWGSDVAGELGTDVPDGRAYSPVQPDDAAAGVSAIAARGYVTCAIINDEARCWGRNDFGQLGYGGAPSSRTPVSLPGTAGATDIAVGKEHSCAIISGGVKCWGSNVIAQLGMPGLSKWGLSAPAQVPDIPSGATSIAAGEYHTCAVVDGAVYCWGYGAPLGAGYYYAQSPSLITDLSAGVTKISAAQSTTCAIVNGGAKCWGGNDSGQLGAGPGPNSDWPIGVVGLGSGVTDISVADSRVCAVANANAYCWGTAKDAYGYGTPEYTPVQIHELDGIATGVGAGKFSTCFTTSDTGLKCAGHNYWGMLGTGNYADSSTYVPPVGLTTGVSQTASGTFTACAVVSAVAKCWGNEALTGTGLPQDPAPIPTDVNPALPGVSKIAVGEHHVCAIATSGISCWGTGQWGELGDGNAFRTHSQAVAEAPDTWGPELIADSSFAEGDTVTDPSQSIAFTADDTRGTVTRLQCGLNGRAPADCGSPWPFELAEGVNTVSVEAEDDSGNVSTKSMTVTLRVDHQPPAISFDTGVSAHYTQTSDNTVAFAVSEDDSGIASVKCNLDGGVYSDCSGGTFSFSLTEGAHTVTVRAVDVAGNPNTTPWKIRKDTADPVVQLTSGPGFSTHQPTIAFSTVDDSPVTYHCQIVSVTGWDSCTSGWIPAGYYGDGEYTVRIDAVDAAGNDTLLSADIHIDTTAPSVSIDAPRNGAVTNDPTPDTAFTVDDDGDLASTQCQRDWGEFTDCTSPFAPSLEDGFHNVVVQVTDSVGNAAAAYDDFTVDATPPALSITSPASSHIENTSTPELHFVAEDTAPDFLGVKCAVDSGTPVDCTSPYTPPALTDDAHSFTVIASDIYGNANTKSVDFSVDTTAPVVTISSPTELQTLATPTPVITFSTPASDIASRKCQLDGTGPAINCSSPYTTGALADGGHSFTVIVIDTAGNVGAATRQFTVDTTAPTLTITSPATDSTTTNHNPVVLFDAVDPAGGHLGSVSCQVDGAPASACTSPFTSPALSDGVHTITIVARDVVGNTRTASISITVSTAAPPPTPEIGGTSPTPETGGTTPPPAITTLPSAEKFPAKAPFGKPIKGSVNCAAKCTLLLTLVIGKTKHVLKPKSVPSGSTATMIKLPKSASKLIRAALNKNPKVKISLIIVPVDVGGKGEPETIKRKG